MRILLITKFTEHHLKFFNTDFLILKKCPALRIGFNQDKTAIAGHCCNTLKISSVRQAKQKIFFFLPNDLQYSCATCQKICDVYLAFLECNWLVGVYFFANRLLDRLVLDRSVKLCLISKRTSQ